MPYDCSFHHRRLRLIATLMISTALSPLLISSQSASAQTASQQRSFNIEPQPLASALRRFAEQSGMQLAYRTADLRGLNSPGFRGQAASAQALGQLLSGTGVSFTMTAVNTVTIGRPDTSQMASPDGAIHLDTVDVAGGRVSAKDEPFRTPGSSGYISQEQIHRLPPTSVGDMFRDTPGVISAGNRNGQSLDLNIRGLQSMGRVATLIDGAQQTSSTYRGYRGHSSRTFIDPEFIGGIDIEKGPSGGPYGAGAMGGVVNMRTLNARDLVDQGKVFGARLRGWFGGNSVDPVLGLDKQRFDGNDLLGTDNKMGSAAAAVATEYFDLVAAVAHRSNGNYFAGKNGDSLVRMRGPNEGATSYRPMSSYRPGGEVFNTSQDNDSSLIKGTVRFGDGHSIELGYIKYKSRFGEEFGDYNNPSSPMWTLIQEAEKSEVVSSIYTAKYRWNPVDNKLVDFHLNAWKSDVNDIWRAYRSESDVVTKGGEVWNTSRFDTAFGALSLKYGGQYSIEDVFQKPILGNLNFIELNGTRMIGSLFFQGDLDLTPWLTLSGGVRYETYKTEDEQPIRSGGRVNSTPVVEASRVNPRASITFKPWDGIRLFATYAEGWRPPTIREAMLNMTTQLIPNPNLRPETSRNYEYGVNLLRDGVFKAGDKLRAKFAYFDNNYENYIMRQYLPGVGAIRWFDNIPSAHFNGFEVSMSYDAVRFFVEGNYNYYTDVRYCNPRGNFRNVPCADFTSNMGADYASTYVPPKYSGAITVGTRWLDERLVIGGRLSFAGERAVGRKDLSSSTANSDWLPYKVYDVFASYKVNDQFSFNMSVENIFDLYYLDGLTTALTPAPGRLMRVGATVKF